MSMCAIYLGKKVTSLHSKASSKYYEPLFNILCYFVAKKNILMLARILV